MIALDVGNTKTAVGFFRGPSLVKTWKLGTLTRRSADEYRVLLNEFLSSVGESLSGAKWMIVSSVVPAVTDELSRLKNEIDFHVVSHKTKMSFEIGIPEPATLGADRIADTEAAVRKYGAPVVIVDAGTATTVSAVDRNKRLLGGAIAPGIGISADALFASAAALTQVRLAVPEKAIGSTTADAIRSGISFGHAELVSGLIRRIRAEMNEPDAPVVATGGAVDLIAPHLNNVTVDRTLTLEGLRYLHENRTGERRA